MQPKPELTEKMAREIVQSYRRANLAPNDAAHYEKEFQFREGMRRAASILYGAEYEWRLSDRVANYCREDS